MQDKINRYNKKGNRDGLWKLYFENAQLAFKTYYKDGEPIGLWEWYDKNGVNNNIKFYAR
jgi:antitoxin component YwqK of YwqJK toxin-antitoxin module